MSLVIPSSPGAFLLFIAFIGVRIPSGVSSAICMGLSASDLIVLWYWVFVFFIFWNCISMYVCMYVCIYVCMCMCVRVYVRTYVCIFYLLLIVLHYCGVTYIQ